MIHGVYAKGKEAYVSRGICADEKVKLIEKRIIQGLYHHIHSMTGVYHGIQRRRKDW
jgi:hypothetical protein